MAFVALTTACEPELVVGTWTCPPPDTQADGSADKVVEVPWTTGFETGFCEYGRSLGYCYNDPDASHRVVDAPVHSGNHAAAFSVTSEPSGLQARCFLEGALPRDATYGAWFYLPTRATNAGNWNLMHFQGGSLGALHGLWDVSLASAADGSSFLYVFGFLGAGLRAPDTPRPVPIKSWFHVEFRFQRAADATGEIALYQDGAPLMQLTGLTTDDTDFGQWYVGNYADALTPANSTVYVDDVTIRAAP